MKKEIFRDRKLKKLEGIQGQTINDVEIMKLKKIPDERGSVCHMLRNDDPIFIQFGEIYFSKVNYGAIKGWHIHKKMFLNYCVISGMIKLVLYDNRKNSQTQGNLLEIFLGDENYLLVKIPPMIWNGIKGISQQTAILANCASLPHDPKEIERLDPFSNKINYNWDIKHG